MNKETEEVASITGNVTESEEQSKDTDNVFDVNDEIIGDEAYENELVNSDVETKKSSPNELTAVEAKAGIIEASPGEILVEVRPQFCKFNEQELAGRLITNVGLKLLCLPWVANTGRHFYTAGCKITETSYEEFKSRKGGSLPKGFYTVAASRKLN